MRRSVPLLLLMTLAGCAGVTEPDRGDGEPATVGEGLRGPAHMIVQGTVDFLGSTGPSQTSAELLSTRVVVRTTGSRAAVLQYSGCPVEIQVFRTAARTGNPAWAQFRQANFACTLPFIERTLAPGDTLGLAAIAAPREILGDSLPPGRYYFAGVVRPNGETRVIPAGEVELRR